MVSYFGLQMIEDG